MAAYLHHSSYIPIPRPIRQTNQKRTNIAIERERERERGEREKRERRERERERERAHVFRSSHPLVLEPTAYQRQDNYQYLELFTQNSKHLMKNSRHQILNPGHILKYPFDARMQRGLCQKKDGYHDVEIHHLWHARQGLPSCYLSF